VRACSTVAGAPNHWRSQCRRVATSPNPGSRASAPGHGNKDSFARQPIAQAARARRAGATLSRPASNAGPPGGAAAALIALVRWHVRSGVRGQVRFAGGGRHDHALRLRTHLSRGARRDERPLGAVGARGDGLPYRVHALDHTGGELDGEPTAGSAPSARRRSSTTTASWSPSRPRSCSTSPRRPAS
jgi:hypothetical protein